MGYKEPFLEGSRNVFCQSRTFVNLEPCPYQHCRS